MVDFGDARARMVSGQLEQRGIADRRVLDAMGAVPREDFVGKGLRESAYEDSPLPIGERQTISQPFIVAYMIEAARLGARDRVLEVGTGSGYAAAVMARIAGEVFTIERHAALSESAGRTLAALGVGNVRLLVGDGSNGWPQEAPFDAIIVAAGSPSVPSVLREQLEIGGRLIIPVGKASDAQRLMRVTRLAADRFEEEDLGGVMFVPLVGKQAWPE